MLNKLRRPQINIESLHLKLLLFRTFGDGVASWRRRMEDRRRDQKATSTRFPSRRSGGSYIPHRPRLFERRESERLLVLGKTRACREIISDDVNPNQTGAPKL